MFAFCFLLFGLLLAFLSVACFVFVCFFVCFLVCLAVLAFLSLNIAFAPTLLIAWQLSYFRFGLLANHFCSICALVPQLLHPGIGNKQTCTRSNMQVVGKLLACPSVRPSTPVGRSILSVTSFHNVVVAFRYCSDYTPARRDSSFAKVYSGRCCNRVTKLRFQLAIFSILNAFCHRQM